MPSVSKRASLGSPEFWLGSKLSERPVKNVKEVVDGRNPGAHAKTVTVAVDERSQAPQQGCGAKLRVQRKRQGRAARVRIEIHGDSVEPVNVAGGVVNGGL